MTTDQDAPFTVAVEAGFDEEGVWAIDARLKFRDGTPPIGSQLLGVGRLALLQRIATEALRGRTLGALWVRVHLEAGTIVKDLHVGGPLPDLDSIL